MVMLRRGSAVVLLAAMATVLAPPSPAQWRLWPSFHDDTETLDQEQPVEGNSNHVGPIGGQGAGQTFVSSASTGARSPMMARSVADGTSTSTRAWYSPWAVASWASLSIT